MATKAEALRLYIVKDYEAYIRASNTDPKCVLRFYWKDSNDESSFFDLSMWYNILKLHSLIEESGIEVDIEQATWAFLSYVAKETELDCYTMGLAMQGINKATGEATEIVKAPIMLFQDCKQDKPSGVQVVQDSNFENLDTRTSINIFNPKPEYAKFANELKPIFDNLVSQILKSRKGL